MFIVPQYPSFAMTGLRQRDKHLAQSRLPDISELLLAATVSTTGCVCSCLPQQDIIPQPNLGSGMSSAVQGVVASGFSSPRKALEVKISPALCSQLKVESTKSVTVPKTTTWYRRDEAKQKTSNMETATLLGDLFPPFLTHHQ